MIDLNWHIEQQAETLSNAAAAMRLLASPEMAELARKHPDCGMDLYSDEIVIRCWLGVVAPEDGDLSKIATSAGTNGYDIDVDVNVGTVAGVPVRLRVTAMQKYTAEEKELLRDLGKLQQQTYTSESLVCGI